MAPASGVSRRRRSHVRARQLSASPHPPREHRAHRRLAAAGAGLPRTRVASARAAAMDRCRCHWSGYGRTGAPPADISRRAVRARAVRASALLRRPRCPAQSPDQGPADCRDHRHAGPGAGGSAIDPPLRTCESFRPRRQLPIYRGRGSVTDSIWVAPVSVAVPVSRSAATPVGVVDSLGVVPVRGTHAAHAGGRFARARSPSRGGRVGDPGCCWSTARTWAICPFGHVRVDAQHSRLGLAAGTGPLRGHGGPGIGDACCSRPGHPSGASTSHFHLWVGRADFSWPCCCRPHA